MSNGIEGQAIIEVTESVTIIETSADINSPIYAEQAKASAAKAKASEISAAADAVATSADRVQTGLDRQAADQSASNALASEQAAQASENAANQDAQATAADRTYIDGQVDHVDSQVAHVDSQVNHVDSQVTYTDGRVDYIDSQVEHVDDQRAHIDNQRTHVDNQVDHVDSQVAHVDSQVTYTDGRVDYIDDQVAHVDSQATFTDGQADDAANSASAAAASETAASDSEDAALASENKARLWAEEDEDIEVETGEYSSKHWAKKAQAYVTGTLRYQGEWDPTTGAYPTDVTVGDFYKVSAAADFDGREYRPDDSIIYNGAGWDHIDNTERVVSVGGYTGTVTDAQLLAAMKRVDGSGSGLDADLLDGLQASDFARDDSTPSLTFLVGDYARLSSESSIAGPGADASIASIQGNSWPELRAVDTKGLAVRLTNNAGDDWSDVLLAYNDGTFTFLGNDVWHAGNDGAGSGLDADTLDGKQLSAIESEYRSYADQAETDARGYTDTEAAKRLAKTSNLSDLANKATARTNLDVVQTSKVTQQTGGTGASMLPAGTTAQRPSSPNYGYTRANTEIGLLEWWNGSSWQPVGSGATGGGGDQVFVLNDQVVTESYSIPVGKNAHSVGPITVQDGAVVTTPDNSYWEVSGE
ncbi:MULTISPECIES: hypothetical protein [Halomonas]|uniref:hypothetical protein n=1 Tax=Halomonas TaxID=2745 RepID=UPI001C945C85|nr:MULTISPECIES: hypothetical protein [Halomonas]MBY6209089.1 hypothetical protein [Halomonas sp. DP3Y7-2]MBY6229245.1 hypothetical protein [Halomonas sp. DP3Y7-1]MCA0917692.1 hypothetical protein [Halomonas denitrificans]